jgi:hypothetical protein
MTPPRSYSIHTTTTSTTTTTTVMMTTANVPCLRPQPASLGGRQPHDRRLGQGPLLPPAGPPAVGGDAEGTGRQIQRKCYVYGIAMCAMDAVGRDGFGLEYCASYSCTCDSDSIKSLVVLLYIFPSLLYMY